MSSKRNNDAIPLFVDLAGKIRVNIADYDGRIIISASDSVFETVWQGLGEDKVRAYNDGKNVRGLAAIRDALEWKSLSLGQLQELNYSSRTRTIKEGDVAVFENFDGLYLVIYIRKIDFTNDDNQHLSIEYYVHPARNDLPYLDLGDSLGISRSNVLGILGHPDAASESAAATRTAEDLTGEAFDLYSGLATAALRTEFALQDFVRTYEENIPTTPSQLGHNQPPPDILIDDEKRNEALAAIRTLGSAEEEDRSSIIRAGEIVTNLAQQIGHWALTKIDKFSDSFADGAGKTLSSRTFLLSIALHFSGFLTHLAELAERIFTKI